MQPCPQCQVAPGEIHGDGCSLERCWNCGEQAIGCTCVYRVFGLDPEEYEEEGAPEALWERFDREGQKFGGRLPWTGEYPGSAACRELWLWCRETPEGRFERCEATDPGATEDVGRLRFRTWDRVKRTWR